MTEGRIRRAVLLRAAQISGKKKSKGWASIVEIVHYVESRGYGAEASNNGVLVGDVVRRLIADGALLVNESGKSVRPVDWLECDDGFDDFFEKSLSGMTFEQNEYIRSVANGKIALPITGRDFAKALLDFYKTKPKPASMTERNGKIGASELGVGESRTYNLADKKRVKNSFCVLKSKTGRSFSFREEKEVRTITVTRLS